MKVRLEYDRGTLIIRGQYGTPFSVWDDRIGAFRAPAYKYPDIKNYLSKSGIEVEDKVMSPPPFEQLERKRVIKLHPYQEEALRFWFSSGSKGVIVLPPGSGKTIIAMEAMERLQKPTLIVVPTLPLLDQWVNRLEDFFGIEVGILGGGKKEIKGVTVSTYDSAYLRAEELGNKFLLAVFDECHHLAAEGYSQIGEMLASEHRMGLTATFEREDGAHVRLLSLIGGVVYKMKPTELAGEHLADFEVVKIPVRLKPEEKEQYEGLMSEYKKSLSKAGIRLERLEDFKKLVIKSGISEDARKALIARNKARKIAINSASKLEALEEILKAHKWDKVLIFTEYNEMAHIIGQRFLIPVLTHRTSPAEREDILEGFRTGRYTKVVTSKVLDEGLDVPDARIAVVLGGSGSRREFIQRLGRILRRKEKRAILYEVVTSGTIEVSASYRRRKALKE
ncbi:MAG TPA: DEAD/DEAH box helicase [Candidatus Korarchaeota archaeon]|nr:DEAD/DEAH box helicase [Candidatus Korarchaeota archaeon]